MQKMTVTVNLQYWGELPLEVHYTYYPPYDESPESPAVMQELNIYAITYVKKDGVEINLTDCLSDEEYSTVEAACLFSILAEYP